MPIKYSGHQWMSTAKPINFNNSITVEAIFDVDDKGNCPTLICMPETQKWKLPIYRLGLHKKTGKPEFQILLEDQREAISVVYGKEVEYKKLMHMAGTYDGEKAILYVDGKEVAHQSKHGTIAQSKEPVIFGGRSKTDEGGFFIGSMYELRLMSCVRTPEEIDFWSHKQMPSPKEVKDWKMTNPPVKEGELQGLWRAW